MYKEYKNYNIVMFLRELASVPSAIQPLKGKC